jgi:hypothetical protein
MSGSWGGKEEEGGSKETDPDDRDAPDRSTGAIGSASCAWEPVLVAQSAGSSVPQPNHDDATANRATAQMGRNMITSRK